MFQFSIGIFLLLLIFFQQLILSFWRHSFLFSSCPSYWGTETSFWKKLGSLFFYFLCTSWCTYQSSGGCWAWCHIWFYWIFVSTTLDFFLSLPLYLNIDASGLSVNNGQGESLLETPISKMVEFKLDLLFKSSLFFMMSPTQLNISGLYFQWEIFHLLLMGIALLQVSLTFPILFFYTLLLVY